MTDDLAKEYIQSITNRAYAEIKYLMVRERYETGIISRRTIEKIGEIIRERDRLIEDVERSRRARFSRSVKNNVIVRIMN